MQCTVTGVWWMPVSATLPGVKAAASKSMGMSVPARSGQAPFKAMRTRLLDSGVTAHWP